MYVHFLMLLFMVDCQKSAPEKCVPVRAGKECKNKEVLLLKSQHVSVKSAKKGRVTSAAMRPANAFNTIQ